MTVSPYEIIRPPSPDGPFLFVCDHASKALPEGYGSLGLKSELFDTHIASDIGAGAVTCAMAKAFAAPAVLARWSRLLIDLNRGEDDPTLVMRLSDGSVIPGNEGVDEAETVRRITNFHAPYHGAIAQEIADLRAKAIVPVIVSMHSFTPIWRGVPRPWQIGILWDRDCRFANPLIEAFRNAGFVVGDNEPYDGELENDTLYRHGTMNGLPHVLIEMRQDLISDAGAVDTMAKRMIPILGHALIAMGPPRIEFSRALPIGANEPVNEEDREMFEAAVFRRLVAHLRERADVDDVVLAKLAGFCRNSLGDWYREAAAERGVDLDIEAARAIIRGLAPVK